MTTVDDLYDESHAEELTFNYSDRDGSALGTAVHMEVATSDSSEWIMRQENLASFYAELSEAERIIVDLTLLQGLGFSFREIQAAQNVINQKGSTRGDIQ